MKFFARLILSGAMILFIEISHPCMAAQSSPGTAGASVASKPKDAGAGGSTVSPAQPVITIHGLCKEGAPKPAGNGASCSQAITREDFEKLVSALNPGGSPLPEGARQTLARNYAEALAFEAAARKEGLEDTVQYREALEFARLRTIAELYRRGLLEKSRTPPQEDIEAYYKQHARDYERAKVTRILIPRENASATDKDAFDKKARAAADAARERAAQGADLGVVQQEAYTSLGLNFAPPSDLGILGRSAFIENEAADIFAVSAGSVTPVEVEPKNYVIYKVTSKEVLTMDLAKPEIVRVLSQQRFRDAVKAITDSAPAEFNEEYFGSGVKSPPPPTPRGMNH